MKHRKHKKKKSPEKELTREERVYEAARNLAEDVGMSFSEALGFTLGIENPTYGWENDLSEEEFQELINNPRDTYEIHDSNEDVLF